MNSIEALKNQNGESFLMIKMPVLENDSINNLIREIEKLLNFETNNINENLEYKQLTEWQTKRIQEAENQYNQGKFFLNKDADILVEKWLSE